VLFITSLRGPFAASGTWRSTPGLYTALAIWEWIHVQHHVDAIPAAMVAIAEQIGESEESPAA
jgi:hypothetical protein